jgi:predicted DNA-binding ribbon-helix-helix protein
MIRKTMRIGEIRTSIKLEKEFWGYLKEVADERNMRLSLLVNEVAAATPDRTNLASTLSTIALMHARLRCQTLQRELDRLSLAGNTQDLTRVLEACPLPCLVLDAERGIKQLNRAFALWLNLDQRATLGQRLDNIMILRGQGLKELWAGLADGRLMRGGFNATYVSPGKVRTAQAIAVALSGGSEAGARLPRGCVVLFETLAGRT